jgi:hypothetical protein
MNLVERSEDWYNLLYRYCQSYYCTKYIYVYKLIYVCMHVFRIVSIFSTKCISED